MPADQQVHISIFLHRCKNNVLRCRNNVVRFVEAMSEKHPVWWEHLCTAIQQDLGGILAVWSYKTELSSRNSLPARVLPPASPCPHTITPCPSKMDLTGMESLWCADRAFLGAQKHTRLHFFEGSITGRQMGVISLQIHRERKGDGKSIVHVVWGVWLGSPPQHS